VLSNSLGREPHDPYAPYYLPGNFDVLVQSADRGIRKLDPVIFKITLERMGVSAVRGALRVCRRHRGEPADGLPARDDGGPRARSAADGRQAPGTAETPCGLALLVASRKSSQAHSCDWPKLRGR
jgi:hypothetical protein